MRGVYRELDDDDDEGGRGIAEWLLGMFAADLRPFAGRLTGDLEVGVETFPFGGGVDGVTLTVAVRFTLNAVFEGGLFMGPSNFRDGDSISGVESLAGRFLSSFSSSDELRRLRVPARVGEGPFLPTSATTDFGLYFGRAEDAALRGLREADRVTLVVWGVVESPGVAGSSEEGVEGLCTTDDLLAFRARFLQSGVLSLFIGGALESPMDLRGAG